MIKPVPSNVPMRKVVGGGGYGWILGGLSDQRSAVMCSEISGYKSSVVFVVSEAVQVVEISQKNGLITKMAGTPDELHALFYMRDAAGKALGWEDPFAGKETA